MELTATVTKIEPVVTGEGKNGTWRKQTIVLRTNGTYPKDVAMTVWGDKVNIPVPGATVTASFDPESRQGQNGNWYTDLRCWAIKHVGDVEQAEPVQTRPQAGSVEGDDKLPF